MNRRELLQCLLVGSLLPVTGWASDERWYAGATADRSGSHFLSVYDGQGQQRLKFPLPSRAHQVISHPQQPWLFVVARRPGRFIQVVDYRSGELVASLDSLPGFDFCGHAQISADGQRLYATENHSVTGEGVVSCRNIGADFTLLGKFSTGGIGPHELLLNDQRQQLVVANGGIQTAGREKVNLASMQPSLSYLDAQSGELLEQRELAKEYHQASIRHLSMSPDGLVAAAMQYQGELTDIVPLVALHRPGEPLKPLELPQQHYFRVKQYFGSACFDRSGSVLAVSAPRGNAVCFWRSSGEFIGLVDSRDGCGLAATGRDGEFMISSGRGVLLKVSPLEGRQQKLTRAQLSWDNHLVSLLAS